MSSDFWCVLALCSVWRSRPPSVWEPNCVVACRMQVKGRNCASIAPAISYSARSRSDGALEALVHLNLPLVLSRLAFLVWPPFLAVFNFAPDNRFGPKVSFRGSPFVGKKLYAGNLSYNVTSAGLEQLFSEFGAVRSAEVIQDRETGRSKGFGFVEMADDDAANRAMQGLNLKEHDGRAMTVNEAKPREERGGGRGGYRSSGRFGR